MKNAEAAWREDGKNMTVKNDSNKSVQRQALDRF